MSELAFGRARITTAGIAGGTVRPFGGNTPARDRADPDRHNVKAR
jgi:hypothetical protein